ncbi:GerMN domain-containing protein [Bacillus sp. B-jedd]|uniref:GerMN domain-containing protein n=1 Tax=Bacillus sp. B-jedd TaxID=1476857 RepID=UPI0005155AF7|nr:GerMN domain-containing protein [Bacillus sp. B-jedd]CEG27694.1 sigma-X negative effector [Bacillus sp. B-jedd]
MQESDPELLAGFPSTAKLSLEGNDTLVVNVPADHHFGEGSAGETNFLNSIKQNVSSNSNVNKIKFKTAGEPGIMLGNTGELTEEPVIKLEHRAYMLVFQKGNEVPYMVPSTKQFDKIEDALAAMKNGIEDENLLPSLEPSFALGKIEEKGGVLHLSLAADAELKNDIPTLYSFEAILLTAKEFGFKAVKLENALIDKLGPFDLKNEINVPNGPNKKEIAK